MLACERCVSVTQPFVLLPHAQEIRGFYHQAGMLPQQLDARLSFAEPAAAAAAPCTSTGGPVQEAATAAAGRSAGSVAGGSSSSSSVAEARVQAEQQSVLRQVQVQDHAAAGPSGDASVHAAAGLRQSRQQQQQDRPKQQQLQAVQQPAEALTPRAARLQRRLQLQQQQQQQVDQHDAENTCPAGKVAVATGGTGSCLAVASGSSCAGVAAVALRQKVAGITADEYGTLPSWCRSLLSVELLNAVLQELSALPAGRCVGEEIVPCCTLLRVFLHTVWRGCFT